jgi:hypothetical protein
MGQGTFNFTITYHIRGERVKLSAINNLHYITEQRVMQQAYCVPSLVAKMFQVVNHSLLIGFSYNEGKKIHNRYK